jgi:glutamate decarboxylase
MIANSRHNNKRIPEASMDPELAYQLIHDDLMLDGNARLNLATFVGTWMEPAARRLMDECVDKNMIDKDEYPQTAELEERCVHMLADLWHAPDSRDCVGTSTTGSSEACMLGGLALKWKWRKRRQAAGLDTSRPNLVMGANTQICWDKFCRYFDVEPRLVALERDRLHLTGPEAAAHCDENTIAVIGVVGSTFDGSYEPIDEMQRCLDALQERTGLNIPIHVDGASGAFVAPFNSPDWPWDFRLPRVASINASGHKYGGVYPGVGWIVWRDRESLPEELIFKVNYLGGEMPTFALNFSRPGAQVVLQYFNFLHLGKAGYKSRMATMEANASYVANGLAAMGPLRLVSHPKGQLPVFAVELDPSIVNYNVFHLADKLRERGWLIPAYTLPPHCEDRTVLRIVIRADFSSELADILLEDFERALTHFGALDGPMPLSEPTRRFAHL